MLAVLLDLKHRHLHGDEPKTALRLQALTPTARQNMAGLGSAVE